MEEEGDEGGGQQGEGRLEGHVRPVRHRRVGHRTPAPGAGRGREEGGGWATVFGPTGGRREKASTSSGEIT